MNPHINKIAFSGNISSKKYKILIAGIFFKCLQEAARKLTPNLPGKFYGFALYHGAEMMFLMENLQVSGCITLKIAGEIVIPASQGYSKAHRI